MAPDCALGLEVTQGAHHCHFSIILDAPSPRHPERTQATPLAPHPGTQNGRSPSRVPKTLAAGVVLRDRHGNLATRSTTKASTATSSAIKDPRSSTEASLSSSRFQQAGGARLDMERMSPRYRRSQSGASRLGPAISR